MKPFVIALAATSALVAGPLAGEPASFNANAAGMYVPPSMQPARYSFVDVYRLTVAGAIAGQPLAEAAPDAPVRLAAVVQAQPAEPRFSITPVRQPEKWLLALAGLALAGWVAHRRLTHAL